MSETKRTVGENALQRMQRLLKKIESELIEEGSTCYLALSVFSDGSGNIQVCGGQSIGSTVFNFATLDELTGFLEAGQLERIGMIRGERER